MGIGSAMSACFDDKSDGIRGSNPFLRGEGKRIEASQPFKPLEFEGFKTWVVQRLPNAQEFDCVAVPHPVANHCTAVLRFVLCDIRQRYEILLIDLQHRDFAALYGHFLLVDHGST